MLRTGDILGYARVSTADQDLSGQKDRLIQNGAVRVFEDVISGKTFNRCSASPLMGTRHRSATSLSDIAQRHRSATLKLEATSHSAKHLSQHKKKLIYGLRKAPSKPSSSFRGSMSRIFTSNARHKPARSGCLARSRPPKRYTCRHPARSSGTVAQRTA